MYYESKSDSSLVAGSAWPRVGDTSRTDYIIIIIYIKYKIVCLMETP